ncbi:MAG: hypothetical protein H6932_05175 [Burkholderiaceae bacterium]|nr:hypothetical protein [Burkholderiaceae bacterium]
MLAPDQALAAAARPSAHAATLPRRALVIGGGGVLGSAVVERLLGSGRFAHVGVWTVAPLQTALRRLEPLGEPDWATFAADTALVVFDRARHANGRDEAFGRPDPVGLPALAARLQALGVRTLVVVVPHAPGLLPQALKAGLASMDEGAVAAQGFAHLVFMRPAQVGSADAAALALPGRLARWLLSQLHWLVPQRDQPVRSATVARVAARLAAVLPAAAPGARVMPPELLWAAAQRPDDDSVVDAWLRDGQLPDAAGARQRW